MAYQTFIIISYAGRPNCMRLHRDELVIVCCERRPKIRGTRGQKRLPDDGASKFAIEILLQCLHLLVATCAESVWGRNAHTQRSYMLLLSLRPKLTRPRMGAGFQPQNQTVRHLRMEPKLPKPESEAPGMGDKCRILQSVTLIEIFWIGWEHCCWRISWWISWRII